jgi:hypothetical protein
VKSATDIHVKIQVTGKKSNVRNQFAVQMELAQKISPHMKKKRLEARQEIQIYSLHPVKEIVND